MGEISPIEKPKPQELSPASKRKQEIQQAKQLVEDESKQMKQKKSSMSPASKRKQLVQQAKKQVEEESKQLEQMKQKTKVKEKGEKEIQEVNALLQECTQALKLEEKQKENKINPAASAAIGAITDRNNGNDHAKPKKEAQRPQNPVPSTKTEPNKHMGARSKVKQMPAEVTP